MIPIQCDPLTECAHLQPEASANRFHGHPAPETAVQYLEEEGQAVTDVRDDAVREDRMSMTATLADDPKNMDFCHGRYSADEIDNTTGVVGVDSAVTFCLAAWTDLLLWPERGHVILEHLL